MNKTILIIDDEAPIRRLSQRLLQRMEYQTLEASSGTEGVEQFEQHQDQVDAVLLDINLPDGSGKDWAVKLRNLKPQLPIIYFTGSNVGSGIRHDSDPQTFFLKKPFTPSAISDVLELAVS